MRAIEILEFITANSPAPPPEARPAQKVAIQDLIAACLIAEAGGESHQGIQAVANVIANRAKHDPNRAQAVILKPKQFSAFNGIGNDPEKLQAFIAKQKKHPVWAYASTLAQQVLAGKIQDVTGGATSYHTTAIHPYWADFMTKTVTIGHHIFYR